MTAAFGFLHAWSSSHLVPSAAALSSTCVLSLPHRFMDGALHVSQPLLLCVSSHLRFHFFCPGHRGPSVKSLIWCARYTECSFVFLFPPFPVSVSVLRVCLPLTASPAAFFGTDPTRSPSYHRSSTLPNLLVRINIRNPFCREYQLPTVPQALALFPFPPSRRFFIFRRLSLQNLLADSASYRRLLTWNPVLCFC